MKPVIQQKPCLKGSYDITPTFGSLSPSLSENFVHISVSFVTQNALGSGKLSVALGVASPLVLWEADRHLYRSLTERLLASWPQRCFSCGCSVPSLSRLFLCTARNLWTPLSGFSQVGGGEGEDGAVKRWKNRGIGGELCSTEARQPLWKYHPPQVSHSENFKLEQERLWRTGQARRGGGQSAKKGEEWYEEDQKNIQGILAR